MKKLLLLALLGAVGSGVDAGAALSYKAPYTQDFNSDTMPDGWQVVDNNKDGYTWKMWFNSVEISEFGKTFTLDDVLISPGFTLDRTRTYLIEYKASRMWGSEDLSSLEVRMGNTPNFDEMTRIVAPEFVVTDYFSPGIRHVIHPFGTQPIYFAFRATGTNTSGISFDDFIIREASMPDKATNIVLDMPKTYGDTHVNLSFNAPLSTVGGDRLLGLSKITVTRSGVWVKDFENPRPGERLLLEDNCPYGSGNYQWKITAYDNSGQEGLTAESDVAFIGVNTPAQPGNLKVVEKEHTGEVTVSWDPVTVDVRGVPMPPEFIDYQLYANGEWLVETGATSPYTFQAVDPDKQDYLVVLVTAKSSYASAVSASPVMIVGKMYDSFRESFNNGVVSTNIRYETDPNKPADFYVFDNSLLYMYSGVQDGDADDTNGCLAISSMYTGYNASVGFGKYDLSAVENPVLKFYTYFPEMAEGSDANVITLYADRGYGYNEVFSYDMSKYPDLTGWQLVTVDLSRFKGQPTAFKIKGTVINVPFVLLDGLTVLNQRDHNLTARTPYAPEKVGVDESFEVRARIENLGNFEAEGATVALLVDGVEVATQPLDPVMPGKARVVSFRHVFSHVCGQDVKVSMRVYYDADEDLSDNISPEVSVIHTLPNYPAVEGLTAQAGLNSTVDLHWNEPSLEIIPVRITESFENGEPNAVNVYGDWTFVDVDDLPTLVIDPNDRFPFQGQTVGGAIADAVGHYMPYFPVTGDRFLAMCGSEDGATNDWAISPELTGEAQEVTFWARSYDPYGYIRESLNFMVSSTGKNIEDFTIVGEPILTSGTWIQYSVEIPEGSKYFAINYKVDLGLMLMLDEFTFIPADKGDPLEIKGYNLYRDGKMVNETLIPETSVTDTDVEAGDHTYHVTTMFNRGESPASNAAKVKVVQGVDAASADGVTISTASGAIVVTAAEPVSVSVADLSGRTVAVREARGTTIIPLAAGVYVVTAGDTTAKVAVL